MEVFKYNISMENSMLNNPWKQQNQGALEFDSFKNCYKFSFTCM